MNKEAQTTFGAKFTQSLTKIGQKLGNEKHLQAISNGMLFGLPFLVIGSLFLIVANPPINMQRYNPKTANFFMQMLAAWKRWAAANYNAITQPYNLTMGVFGIICVFGIAYELSNNYHRQHSATEGMIAVTVFMMVTTTIDKNSNINLNYLGTNGMFVAIIVGLLSIELDRLVDRDRFKIKLPATVPPMVATFVNSLIPLILNIIVFYGANLIIVGLTHNNFPAFITKLLTPATSIATNIWGFVLIITIGNVLWLIGINGNNIVFPIVFTIGIAQTGLNAAMVAKGLAPTHLMNLQMYRVSVLGGSGNTLALVFLMMRSKVEKYKAVGRLSLIPGICGINEPVIFGGPICFNPIFGIPFIIAPIVNLLLTYFAQELHIIGLGYIVDPSFTPFFAQAYMCSMDWRNVVFWFFLLAVAYFIYLPFFRVAEKAAMAEQKETLAEAKPKTSSLKKALKAE